MYLFIYKYQNCKKLCFKSYESILITLAVWMDSRGKFSEPDVNITNPAEDTDADMTVFGPMEGIPLV